MRISNLDSMTYCVTDRAESERFWTDFGLTPQPAARGACSEFSAQDGSTVVLCDADDPSLPPPAAPNETLREATFGVVDAGDLSAIADSLGRDHPVTVDSDGTLHTVDPAGFGIAFRVSRRRPVQAPEPRFNTPGRPARLNTRAEMYSSARPLEMTHTVFMVGDEIDRIAEFYTHRLGFVMTDCYAGRGCFLRGAASIHHHDLFLLNAGPQRGFHHVAFELGSIHELFGGGLNMTRRGWTTALGPGRHAISSSYFWYFRCPSGGAAEYDFDTDQVDGTWQPETFEQTPENFAEWCLAEGMQDALVYKGVQRAETARKR